ncbi:MAG: nitroreductase [Myxococcales bacterium]|nr:nitroreductase [Myxococcales bacterium]
MDVYAAIHGRRTVHRYRDEPVADEVMARLLGAAHMAPNHKLTWPWRFTRVGARTRREVLYPLGVRLKAKGREPSERLWEVMREKLVVPAELVVVSVRRSDDAVRAREDYAAAACAIQNLLLAATAEGLGAKWSSGALTQHAETYAALGLDAAAEEIVGFIWVGVADEVPTIKRPPIEAHVRVVP